MKKRFCRAGYHYNQSSVSFLPLNRNRTLANHPCLEPCDWLPNSNTFRLDFFLAVQYLPSALIPLRIQFALENPWGIIIAFHSSRLFSISTNREQEILNLLVSGKPHKQIAEALFLSSLTIATHMKNIYAKLHVHLRSEAVAKALKERRL